VWLKWQRKHEAMSSNASMAEKEVSVKKNVKTILCSAFSSSFLLLPFLPSLPPSLHSFLPFSL
jgi:hypothetical protein